MLPADPQLPSTRPYLIRALHEWCTEHGFTPYLAVKVDAMVQVPAEHVRDGEIVLNASFDATSGLRLGNDFIEFKARFGGIPRDIVIPVDHVIAIYARENGQGMAFPAPPAPSAATEPAGQGSEAEAPSPGVGALPEGPDGPPGAPPTPGRPHLKRVK